MGKNISDATKETAKTTLFAQLRAAEKAVVAKRTEIDSLERARGAAVTKLRTEHGVKGIMLGSDRRPFVCVNAAEVKAAKAAGTVLAKLYDLGTERAKTFESADESDEE